MLVYFIRHGESENNSKGIYTGHMDVSLTPEGIKQAELVGAKLSNICFDAVYSSDLKRAVQTARAAVPGAEIIIDKRLREINIGSLSGKLIKSIRQDNPDKIEALDARDYRPFGGECDADTVARISSFIDELKIKDYDSVAVFCHGGILHSVLESALGVSFPPNRTSRRNCTITVYELTEDRMTLVSWDSKVV